MTDFPESYKQLDSGGFEWVTENGYLYWRVHYRDMESRPFKAISLDFLKHLVEDTNYSWQGQFGIWKDG